MRDDRELPPESDSVRYGVVDLRGAVFTMGAQNMPPFEPARPQGVVAPAVQDANQRLADQHSHTLQNIQDALVHAQSTLPQLLGFLANFIPQLRAVLPFLKLLPVAIQGVQAVQQATGADPATAVEVVKDQLTPGRPNSPALSGPQQGSGG